MTSTSISELRPGRARALAVRIDEESDRDGAITAAELTAAATRLEKDGSLWSDEDRDALVELSELFRGRAQSGTMLRADVFGVTVELTRLNDTQRSVLTATRQRAKRNSDAAHARLLELIQGHGFTQADLTKTLEYIRSSAPITINFQPGKQLFSPAPNGGDKVIDSFLSGAAEYQNQFETRMSGGYLSPSEGSSRDTWERKIFAAGYHTHPLIPEERPKYGSLNAEERPDGGASSYGDAYLVLKDEARGRATFTPHNSSGCNADQVGTVEHIEHVLAGLSGPKLRAIMKRAVDGEPDTGDVGYRYCEAQIHGPVEFGKDIAEVVAHERYRGTEYEAKLRDFATRCTARLSWHDGTAVTPDGA